jgi:chromosome segregation ATPase
VELLGTKLKEAERVENQRKTALRGWKKKVQELEKACRYLEEEVDSSRQMSMERSVMDEASGEALRMLHRQIAALERERGEQLKREHMMREEIETLETLVKERSDDVLELKETLWNRDESERELSRGMNEVKAQVDEMGNVSMAYIDEDELRRLREEKEQATEAEKNRHRVVELQWQQEKEELIVKLEGLNAERTAWEEDLEKAKLQLKARDEEYETLKAELEAQWSHTEQMSEKIGELEKERDELKLHVEDLESRISSMEVEWNESENKKTELENEIQELWNLREALEKDRDQVCIAPFYPVERVH